MESGKGGCRLDGEHREDSRDQKQRVETDSGEAQLETDWGKRRTSLGREKSTE